MDRFFVNAGHCRLESRRQVAHEIEHQFLGAADHERMRQVEHTRAPKAALGRAHSPIEGNGLLEAMAEPDRRPPVKLASRCG